MALMRLSTRTPPSSLTASTSASLKKRTAFPTACSSEAWYEPNGMSPITKVFGAPRRTALQWLMQSSIVTGIVPG